MKHNLGGAIYGERVGNAIKLTTENGFGASNEIWMDMSALYAFFMFIQAAYNWDISVAVKEKTYGAADQHDASSPRREA